MHISGAIYTNGKVIVTHIHNLHSFNYDEERTDPVTVAQQNALEFIIEVVLKTVDSRVSNPLVRIRC